jgi:hypothetical protein
LTDMGIAYSGIIRAAPLGDRMKVTPFG